LSARDVPVVPQLVDVLTLRIKDLERLTDVIDGSADEGVLRVQTFIVAVVNLNEALTCRHRTLPLG
jgi:hypothetical protein